MVIREGTRRARQTGIAATELALVLPFLCFIFAITVDFSRIFYYTISLEYAARDGCYYASNYPGLYDFNSSTDQKTNIKNAALGESSNISPPPDVQPYYDSSYTGTFQSQTPPATSTGYVRVTVTYTFNTIMNFPGVPSNTVVQRSVTMAMAPVTPS